ncbi:TetR/AcrR family transcriptional regulator [Microbacterium nymphoidis]|uniref:TetR/AcrR family transcriptional regulator n=1 Tax=Microbacterium nymphoidis TaxID=2898586 RepID=UPI001E559F8C|nr:TetR/AcrR family transcriptional regulator [Microbacterium nymphoidis]MCD2497134.1 TetR/AcrR family transcriptional regulator [Microbacterium nymphoidis]
MSVESRQGRPRVSSRETLAEAACELFLERGYEATNVADITARAGVSRSSFFNYFSSKHDVLWAGVDDAIAALEDRLQRTPAEVVATFSAFSDGLAPDSLALAIANDEAMGAVADLQREGTARAARIGAAVTAALRAVGWAPLRAQVIGSAYGSAVLAAVERWARDGSGRTALADRLDEALAIVAAMPGAATIR